MMEHSFSPIKSNSSSLFQTTSCSPTMHRVNNVADFLSATDRDNIPEIRDLSYCPGLKGAEEGGKLEEEEAKGGKG